MDFPKASPNDKPVHEISLPCRPIVICSKINQVSLIRNLKNRHSLKESENLGTKSSLTTSWLSECIQLCDVLGLFPKAGLFQSFSTWWATGYLRTLLKLHLLNRSLYVLPPWGPNPSPIFTKEFLTWEIENYWARSSLGRLWDKVYDIRFQISLFDICGIYQNF